jgi:hypothetical protein
MDYFKNEIEDMEDGTSAAQTKKLNKFKQNLLEGIIYYKELFSNQKEYFKNEFTQIFQELQNFENELLVIEITIPKKINV